MVIIVLHWRLQETMRSCRVPDELVAEVAQFLAEMMVLEDDEVEMMVLKLVWKMTVMMEEGVSIWT